jgi:protocatechuate 3,4-dioxygenase beta subunit
MGVDAGIVPPANTASLGNYVWIDLNNDGLQTVGEPAVPGVTVKLYNAANTVIAVATTNSEGKYLFTGLAAGNYSVGFENLPAGFIFTTLSGAINDATNSDANSTTGKTAEVSLALGDNNLNLDAGIRSTSTAVVGNYVWYDEDADGIQDATEAPIPGVLVTLINNTTGLPVASAVTDASGHYLFTNVTPGSYKIGFTGYPVGLVPTTKGTNPSADDDSNVDPLTIQTNVFTVAAGTSDLTFDAGFKANPIAGLGNTVWFDANNDGLQDATELGISGVVVTLFDAAGTNELGKAITDGEGHYSFPNLVVGTYRVGFTAPTGMVATLYNIGGEGVNGALNSDIDGSFMTLPVTLTAGAYNPNLDAGFYTATPLPIVLTSLDAVADNCTVNVRWVTAAENNVSHFNVMRKSTSENTYTAIAKVIASGNSKIERHYSYSDENVSDGTFSYMLNTIDIDAIVSKSDEVTATVNCDVQNQILVYPNPTTDKLTVTFTNTSTNNDVAINILDLTGKIVLSKTVNPSVSNNIVLNVEALAVGNYILQITNLDSGTYNRKINIIK